MQLTRTTHTLAITLDDNSTLPLGPILGIGRNYADHAAEQGAAVPERPMVFNKNPASAILSGDDIVIPQACSNQDQVDYEGELAVIIGAAARDVSEAKDLSHVLAYCCANDVSARWWQKQGAGGQFWRGKSFDTFCPLGPTLTPAANIPDPQDLRLTTRLNGDAVQDASTSQMIFPVATIIAELSRGLTLTPGTVILTGTPSGCAIGQAEPRFLRDGDEVEVEIEYIGILRNGVRTVLN